MTNEFSKIFTENIIEHGRFLKEWRMPGAGHSLTSPAPKILEGNAVEIVEIDEWVLSDPVRPAFRPTPTVVATAAGKWI
jgi:hypothetical protein